MPPGSSLHHRNRRKRLYLQLAEYFITSVTYLRKTYFVEPISADLFVADLWFAKELKELELFGYTVLPDHVHLLFQPLGKANFSQIMGTLKRNVSRDINDLISSNSFLRNADNHVGDDSKRRPHDLLNQSLLENYEKTKKAHIFHSQFTGSTSTNWNPSGADMLRKMQRGSTPHASAGKVHSMTT
jgi:REP element-mobilizing transposase RayT